MRHIYSCSKLAKCLPYICPGLPKPSPRHHNSLLSWLFENGENNHASGFVLLKVHASLYPSHCSLHKNLKLYFLEVPICFHNFAVSINPDTQLYFLSCRRATKLASQHLVHMVHIVLCVCVIVTIGKILIMLVFQILFFPFFY